MKQAWGSHCPYIIFVILLALSVFTAAQQQTPETSPDQQPSTAADSSPSCRGLGRKVVDWWVMLKHPSGYQYSYLDSNNVGSCEGGSCWRHRLTMLNPNPLGHTLAQLQQASNHKDIRNRPTIPADIAYVLYNDDDPPGTEHFDFAHAKGVVAFSHSSTGSSTDDSSYQGFWMIHSAPRFPKDPKEDGFSELARAQSVFGQHFSCFSLMGNQSITAVAAMLLTAGPYIYSSHLPDHLAAQYPAWKQLLDGTSSTLPASVHISLETAAGLPLHAFAKTKYLNVSLTDAVVGPMVGSNMLWETWRRSHDALPSHCPQGGSNKDTGSYNSLNIQQIAFPGTPYTWHFLSDHSKWGITSGHSWSGGKVSGSSRRLAGGENDDEDDSQHVVCLGDMNRAWWQSRRGGEFVCFEHLGAWQAFANIVAAVEPCEAVT